MKKSIVLALAVAFLAATSGLVMAQDTAGSAPPKTTHHGKGHHGKGKGKHKKGSKSSSTSTTTAPAPSGDGTSPAGK